MKVSIVTATFNSAATVGDTIESVLSQSHQDWEHVIVDGGSTDGTLDIIERYRERYGDRLSLSSAPDKGLYDAMNRGVVRATGDIVGILNSDDFYTRQTVLERLVGAFSADDSLDAVYGDIMYVDANDTSRVLRYYSSAGFRRWKMRLGFMPAHPSFYCRRTLYERFGTFDLDFRVASDFENLLRIIYVGRAKTLYMPMNFVTMRLGGASTSGMASHRVILRDHLNAYRKNHIHSGLFLDLLRYPYKLAELVSFRLHSHRNS